MSSFATSLHALADFYEANPDFPTPAAWNREFRIHTDSADTFKEAAVMMSTFVKKPQGSTFSLEKIFNNGEDQIALKIQIGREEICTRRVVGRETLPSHYTPGRTVDKVEWDCPGYLLSRTGNTQDDHSTS